MKQTIDVVRHLVRVVVQIVVEQLLEVARMRYFYGNSNTTTHLSNGRKKNVRKEIVNLNVSGPNIDTTTL
jgi:hypothetical protein